MIAHEVGSEYWITVQRDQAVLAADLADHWGNGEFIPVERYLVSARHQQEFRGEVLTAIAKRDIGWQDSDTAPAGDDDELPKDFTTLAQQELMVRWRRSVNHFAEENPFVALLISQYLFWLFAHQCDLSQDPAFRHPVLCPADWAALPARETWRKTACEFIREQKLEQNRLLNRLQNDTMRWSWTTAQVLMPTVRLFQLVDALSLSLSRGGAVNTTILDVPRRGWHDRVRLQLDPDRPNRVSLSPYPFATNPLKVQLKLRRIQQQTSRPQHTAPGWKSVPLTKMWFEFNSRSSGAGKEERRNLPSVENLSWLYYERS